MSGPRVLVVDDDPNVTDVVSRYLTREGMDVEVSADGASALDRALKDSFDLVVLDLMLPGLDGLEVCRRLRLQSSVPIVMLTARGDEDDRVAGLQLGADDYLSKPFSPRELVARVAAVLRRTSAPPQVFSLPVIQAGALRIDRAAREATRDGHALALTTIEFDLLAFLMSNPNIAFRREQLLERVWGFSSGDTSTVTVHIRRLREKIEDSPARPKHIQTLWGVGYRWEA